MTSSNATNRPISIIIPTLNEADFLGYLLFSLSRQTYKNFEVIVSDGNSEDETVKVAKTFSSCLPSLKIVSSPERSPANQRNNGAKFAQYERILFLDADVILPPEFLEKGLRELEERKLDLAHPISFCITKNLFDQYLQIITNQGLVLLEKTLPVIYGWAIFSTKTWHKKIGGFDKRLRKIGEDADYVSRALKLKAKFGILKNCDLFVSARRMDVEGRGCLIKNMALLAVLFTVFGKYKTQDMIERPYGNLAKVIRSLKAEKKTNLLFQEITPEQLRKVFRGLKKAAEEAQEGFKNNISKGLTTVRKNKKIN